MSGSGLRKLIVMIWITRNEKFYCTTEPRRSPFLEDDRNCSDHHGEADKVIPLQRLMKIKDREKREDGQRYDLLYRLQLRRRKLIGTDAIGGNLKTVFSEGDHPANNDDFKERRLSILQVSIPGKSHEDI